MFWFTNRFIKILIKPKGEWEKINNEKGKFYPFFYLLILLLMIGIIHLLNSWFSNRLLPGTGTITQTGLVVFFMVILFFIDAIIESIVVYSLSPFFTMNQIKTSFISAFKLISYSFTPMLINSFISISKLPKALSIIFIFYRLFIMWHGLSIMIDCKREKRLLLLLLTLIISLLLFVLSSMFYLLI